MSTVTFKWTSDLGTEFTVPYDHTIATRPRFGASCTLAQELIELENAEASLSHRIDEAERRDKRYELSQEDQEILMRLRRLRHVLGKS